MKLRVFSFLVTLLLAITAAAQQGPSSQDLPSAPSAVKEQEKPRPPAPEPAPQQPAQSAPAQPASQTQASTNPTPAPAQPAEKQPSPAVAPSSDGISGSAAAAKPAASSDAGDEPDIIIRKTVDEVNVIFTVTDKHGRFVKDLKKNDFRVLDDNKPAASIVDFRSETNLPLRVGLLVDASNSVRDRFRFEQEAAIEFLNSIVRPRFDQAFVIGFDTTAEVTQDFTDSSEKLSRGVRLLRPGGGTAMYDAIYWACRDKLMKAGPENQAVRRAVILLSDGEDNQSRVSREEAIEMAQRAEVIVYTISTNISGVKLRGDKVLERIADATGGRAFFPFKIQDVANAFSEIQDELRSQYAVSYKPADLKRDGKYRTIDIAALDKKLHVRSRKGYFAPTQ